MRDPTRKKWDRASRTYDFTTRGDERRYGPAKRRLFERMRCQCLMLAAGTGMDFRLFLPGLQIVALDISRAMLERAEPLAAEYPGRLSLLQMDAHRLGFRDATFDTIATSCTFCSVPDPVRGLRELHRVLKPEGRLLMFEHVRSRIGPIALMQDLLTPLSRRVGPDLNRDTLGNLARAGFRIVDEENAYLDIVKAVEAVRG